MDKQDSTATSIATINNTVGSGTILSQDSRNSIFRNAAVDSSISNSNLTLFQNKQRQLDIESSAAIVEQQQSFIGLNSGIQGLRVDIGKLGTGLSQISILLQQDAANEQARIINEQEQQRRLAEQQIRIGKEDDVEQKIQNAITEPAQKLVPEVNDLFGNIGNALTILFGGWLTTQTVKGIEAAEQGNTDSLNNIKFNILKNVGIAIGGLFAINKGFSLIKNTMGGIVGGLARLFIPRPNLGGGIGGGGGALPGFGKFVIFLSSVLNWKNKEYTDSILSAISLASIVPGPLGAIAKIAGIAFTADEIAEAFGKNIFGDDRDNLVNQIAQRFMGQSATSPASQPPSTPTTPATPTLPTIPSVASSTPVQPQQTMAGQPPAPTTPTPTSTTPPLTPEKIAQFERAWKYRNNSLARGQIEGAWAKLTLEEKRQAKEWAKSKGYDWTEMKLSDPDTTQSSSTTLTTVTAATAPSAPPSSTSIQPSVITTAPPPEPTTTQAPTPAEIIPPAQVSTIPREPQQVGQLPEPNPKITMIAPFLGTNQPQPQPPITNGPLTDVPLISSANPDNFYVLYSQLSYNVVT